MLRRALGAIQGLKLTFLTIARRASDIKCLLARENFNLL